MKVQITQNETEPREFVLTFDEQELRAVINCLEFGGDEHTKKMGEQIFTAFKKSNAP